MHMNFINKLYTNYNQKKEHNIYCLTRDDIHSCDTTNVLTRSINTAQQTIFACVYKFTNNKIVNVLEDALNRGIKIMLIMDYKNNHSSQIVDNLRELGADIMFWNKHEKLHAKFVIIDNTIVLTGSFNWTVSKRHKVDLIISLFDTNSIMNFHSLFNELKDNITTSTQS